jgi:hypothetical protein
LAFGIWHLAVGTLDGVIPKTAHVRGAASDLAWIATELISRSPEAHSAWHEAHRTNIPNNPDTPMASNEK